MEDLSLEAIQVGMMFDKLSDIDKEKLMAMVKVTQEQGDEIRSFGWSKDYTIH